MTTITRTTIYTSTHTATYLCDAIRANIVQLLQHLGLDGLRLSNDWDSSYASAIRAWIEEGSLKTVVLECTTPSGITKRFDFDVEYLDGTTVRFRNRTQTMAGYLVKIASIPSSSTWRIVCRYHGPHSSQPGWSSTSLAAATTPSMSFGTVAQAPHDERGTRCDRRPAGQSPASGAKKPSAVTGWPRRGA